MKKMFAAVLAAVLAVALPVAVWAGCTYSSPSTGSTIARCNLTTEARPTLVTEGADLAWMPGGPVGGNGQLSGGDFPDSGPWRQC